jgi:predicted ATP-dependent Lon-type protease
VYLDSNQLFPTSCVSFTASRLRPSRHLISTGIAAEARHKMRLTSVYGSIDMYVTLGRNENVRSTIGCRCATLVNGD